MEIKYKNAFELLKANDLESEYKDVEVARQLYGEKGLIPDTNLLRNLYWKDGLSTYKLSKLFGVNQTTVLRWMRKQEIETRALSEACMKYPKSPFSGDPAEKQYMLGLLEDLYIRKLHKGGKTTRIETSTNVPAMIELFCSTFISYGHCNKCPEFKKGLNQFKWHLFAHVDAESFGFLKHTKEIPKGELFWFRVGGIFDAEGWLTITPSHKNFEIVVGIGSTNLKLLRRIEDEFKENGFNPNIFPSHKAGTVSSGGIMATKDQFILIFTRRGEVIRFIEKLLPRIRHKDKIIWMRLGLEVKDKKRWANIKDRVMALRKRIGREVEDCMEQAKTAYIFRKVLPIFPQNY